MNFIHASLLFLIGVEVVSAGFWAIFPMIE